MARLGLCVIVFLAGCAPFTAVSGRTSLGDHGMELEMPAGWYRVENIGKVHLGNAGFPFPALLIDKTADTVLLTRDGLELQVIRLDRLSIDRELPHTKRKATAGMPVHDLAELELDNVRANPEALNFTLVENLPATVAGRSGFRLVYGWKTRKGLAQRAVHYGFMDGRHVYRIVYQGAARHYFERDLDAFERIRTTLRVTKPAA